MAGGKGKEALTYDRMGNILSLGRSGTTSSLVDDLFYTYSGNHLTKVVDANTGAPGVYQPSGATTYAYDANGNLKARGNAAHPQKNITGIIYNHLNLPHTITTPTGTMTYIYDATGRKLRSMNGITGTTRDYIDGIEYSGGTLELVHMEEGRIVKSGGSYEYDYVLRDHLGNGRVGFKQSSTPTTTPNFTADYYPFGLRYQSDIRQPSPKNNYLFQNQELQEGLGWYHFKWRMHDPVTGRFMVVDPLVEKFYYNSPYAFSENKVVAHRELEGLEAFPINTRYPLATVAEGFRQYFQAAGTFVDRAYLQIEGTAGYIVSKAKVNLGLAEASILTSVDGNITTTAGTNLGEFFSIPTSENQPAGPLFKFENDVDISLNKSIEGNVTINGIDVQVSNIEEINSNGKISNTAEAVVGKGENGIFASKKSNGKLDIGLKIGASQQTGNFKFSVGVKLGATIMDEDNDR